MARRPTQYGTAHVKQKDAVRPLLVLLIIGASAIALFLWLQADTVDPVLPVAAETEAPAADDGSMAAIKQPKIPDTIQDLESWWFDVETRLVDAFEGLDAAMEGSCYELESGVADLGQVPPRREPPIQSPFSGIISSLDRALAGCRNGNTAIVQGAGQSARQQLETLIDALDTFGVAASTYLSDP